MIGDQIGKTDCQAKPNHLLLEPTEHGISSHRQAHYKNGSCK
ncbi:hypothetical protein VIB_002463 [Vibrio metschnikovii CIP 69.14]|nr:hypothetical protein VIB_002463 [Vibrio metschnikovii CIP 69.14]